MKLQHEVQAFIFKFAEREKIELADALKYFGYTFDDLAYEHAGVKSWAGPNPLSLKELRQEANNIPFVSFFTGCGGMDLGFEAAGFRHTAAFEINELFCKTIRKNKPNWNVYGPPTHSGDVSNFRKVVSTLENLITPNFNGVFVGGPPCQPFSIAANQRFAKTGDNFKRIGFEHEVNGPLLFDYLRLIEFFQPTCFIIENVPGLRDLDDGEQLEQVINALHSLGYLIEEPRIVNAADYGVPQSRERLFVVGTRGQNRFVYPQKSTTKIGCGSVLQNKQIQSTNNETRMHKLVSVLRYVKLDYGQRDQMGRVDRLDPCLPSKTVIAGGESGGGRSHLHPEIPRTLSVRECARLQTFPDDYTFVGSTARQFTQVGNAVPPVLAAQIANAVAETVFNILR